MVEGFGVAKVLEGTAEYLVLAAPFADIGAVKVDLSIGMAPPGTFFKYFVAFDVRFTLSYTILILPVVISNGRDNSAYWVNEVLASGFCRCHKFPISIAEMKLGRHTLERQHDYPYGLSQWIYLLPDEQRLPEAI
jgi:hypothetical protein